MLSHRLGRATLALLAVIALSGVACAPTPTGRPAGSAPTAPVAASPAASVPSSAPAAASAPSPAATPAPPTIVRLGMVSPSWGTQLPLAVTQQLGLFQQAGLDVRSVTMASGGTMMVAMLVSGEADMIVAGIEAPLAGIAAGAPAVIVANVESRMDYGLVGSKGMTRLDDLRGKIVGATAPGSRSEFAVEEALRRNGLMRDRDYLLRGIGGTQARRAAMYAGQIDAAPFSSGDRVPLIEDGWPVLLDIGKTLTDVPATALTVHNDFAARHPDKVVAMLRALAQGMEVIRTDPDRTVALAKAYGLEGDPVTLRKALDHMLDMYYIGLTHEAVANYMRTSEQPGRSEDFFDDRFLKEAERAR